MDKYSTNNLQDLTLSGKYYRYCIKQIRRELRYQRPKTHSNPEKVVSVGNLRIQ